MTTVAFKVYGPNSLYIIEDWPMQLVEIPAGQTLADIVGEEEANSGDWTEMSISAYAAYRASRQAAYDALLATRPAQPLSTLQGISKEVYIISEGNAEGNITLFDDGYWNTSEAFIDSIEIVTESSNWSLYMCENDDFDTDDITSRLLVEYGLGNTTIPVSAMYHSISTSIYFVYTDIDGAAPISFYITGRTLGS